MIELLNELFIKHCQCYTALLLFLKKSYMESLLPLSNTIWSQYSQTCSMYVIMARGGNYPFPLHTCHAGVFAYMAIDRLQIKIMSREKRKQWTDPVWNRRRGQRGLCCGRGRGSPWTLPAEERGACPSLARVQGWGEADVGAEDDDRPVVLWAEAEERGAGEERGREKTEDVVRASLLTAEAAKPHTRTQSCSNVAVPSFFCLYFNGRLALHSVPPGCLWFCFRPSLPLFHPHSFFFLFFFFPSFIL